MSERDIVLALLERAAEGVSGATEEELRAAADFLEDALQDVEVTP